ncbi:hypothetical protein [Desulforhopalus sp. IMCC35007]|uniref:hypothetical protein n=1 Tax=Desulforhopalus sp. IMCC35007 TaxID=2569543 RepID=UPI0026AE4913
MLQINGGKKAIRGTEVAFFRPGELTFLDGSYQFLLKENLALRKGGSVVITYSLFRYIVDVPSQRT